MRHNPKGRHVERPPTPEPNKAELPGDIIDCQGETELPTKPDHAPALDKTDRSDRAVADTVHGDKPCHCQHCNTARKLKPDQP